MLRWAKSNGHYRQKIFAFCDDFSKDWVLMLNLLSSQSWCFALGCFRFDRWNPQRWESCLPALQYKCLMPESLQRKHLPFLVWVFLLAYIMLYNLVWHFVFKPGFGPYKSWILVLTFSIESDGSTLRVMVLMVRVFMKICLHPRSPGTGFFFTIVLAL